MHNCSPIHMYTMKELTTRQIEILDFITNYEWRHGFWPSIRNIQMEFDYKSTNAVMGHLRALERKGAIERIPGQARTFRINRPDSPQANFESEIPGGVGAMAKDVVAWLKEKDFASLNASAVYAILDK